MTPYDYAVLAAYFAFMVVIGWVLRWFVRDVSDYFRGGGKAVWWLVGGSAFMVAFSAWTFTGAASKAYADGWPITVIYVSNAVGFLLAAVYFAPRFRQMRVITAVEAVRHRFGRLSEQVFVWLQIPLGTLQAGIWLSALGVFFSAALGFDLMWTIIVTGSVVLVMALFGGTWAVLAGDFIQALILMPICLVITVLVVARLGGWDGFATAIPAAHLDPGQVFDKEFLGLWCLAMLCKQIAVANNLLEANRYLSAKDSRHARRAALLGAVLFLLGAVVWFIPPMAARAWWPDMVQLFPRLGTPEEASFIAAAREVMPAGMLGLLVSGIFAATMSSMDAGLNKNAGIFVVNFYRTLVRPRSGDREQLLVGQAATVVLGVVVIVLAIWMSEVKRLGLFVLMQRVSILVGVPILVPLVLGLFARRTPSWSAWSTVLVGFASSAIGHALFPAATAAQVLGFDRPFDAISREYWTQGFQLFATMGVSTLWFFGTMLFWGRTPAAERARIESFYARLDTPVDFDREQGRRSANDRHQAHVIGWLCVALGVFVLLLALIPNPAGGRLAFAVCGLPACIVGLMLVRSGAPARGRAPRDRGAPGVVETVDESRQVSLVAALTPAEMADFLPEPQQSELRRLCSSLRVIPSDVVSPEAFDRELAESHAEVLITCWRTRRLPPDLPARLRYVCHLAGSVKNLVSREHLERGLLVTNWGSSISRVVAEGALTHILGCLRRTSAWAVGMHCRDAWKDEATVTASLFGRRVGLHGFGRVARELVRLLRPWDVSISVCAPDVTDETEREWGVRREVSLEALFRENDVIVELAPLLPATARIVRERHLRLIRPGGVFVNVARGDLVDEEALITVAREGRVQFGLDVFSVEPLPAGHALRGLPNVALTPHLAGPTSDRRRDAGAWAIENLRAYVSGGPMSGLITPEDFDRSA